MQNILGLQISYYACTNEIMISRIYCWLFVWNSSGFLGYKNALYYFTLFEIWNEVNQTLFSTYFNIYLEF